MKKFKKLLVGLVALVALTFGGSQAFATDAGGISINPIKQNWSYSTDTDFIVAIQNHNSYATGANYEAQQNVNGKWVTLDWNSPNPLDPGQKVYDHVAMSYFYGKTGIFRLKFDVDIYDTNGDWVRTVGTYYTDAFYIRN